MTLREGAARAGFQVLLEATRSPFGWRFNRYDHPPRAMVERVTGRAVIVPVKPAAQVIRETLGGQVKTDN